jgi:hypothetical protein
MTDKNSAGTNALSMAALSPRKKGAQSRHHQAGQGHEVDGFGRWRGYSVGVSAARSPGNVPVPVPQHTWEKIAAFVFGVVFITTLLVVAIAFPQPTSFQYEVFRIVLAIACGGIAAVIPGFLAVSMDTKGLVIRAGGALAVFLLVYFFSPARLVSSDADPSIVGMLQRIEGMQRGGDTFAYWMLYHFDMNENVARNFVIIRRGQYPLYDLRITIRDMDAGRDVFNSSWGEISAPAEYLLVRWQLPPSVYYRVSFHARNGQWRQDLILKKSEALRYWVAATRVFDKNGKDIVFEHIDDPDFVNEFGAPAWR